MSSSSSSDDDQSSSGSELDDGESENKSRRTSVRVDSGADDSDVEIIDHNESKESAPELNISSGPKTSEIPVSIEKGSKIVPIDSYDSLDEIVDRKESTSEEVGAPKLDIDVGLKTKKVTIFTHDEHLIKAQRESAKCLTKCKGKFLGIGKSKCENKCKVNFEERHDREETRREVLEKRKKFIDERKARERKRRVGETVLEVRLVTKKYIPDEDNREKELTLKQGDVILVLQKNGTWWFGRIRWTDERGLFKVSDTIEHREDSMILANGVYKNLTVGLVPLRQINGNGTLKLIPFDQVWKESNEYDYDSEEDGEDDYVWPKGRKGKGKKKKGKYRLMNGRRYSSSKNGRIRGHGPKFSAPYLESLRKDEFTKVEKRYRHIVNDQLKIDYTIPEALKYFKYVIRPILDNNIHAPNVLTEVMDKILKPRERYNVGYDIILKYLTGNCSKKMGSSRKARTISEVVLATVKCVIMELLDRKMMGNLKVLMHYPVRLIDQVMQQAVQQDVGTNVMLEIVKNLPSIKGDVTKNWWSGKDGLVPYLQRLIQLTNQRTTTDLMLIDLLRQKFPNESLLKSIQTLFHQQRSNS